MAVVPAAVGSRADLPGVPEQPEILTLSPLSQTNYVGEQVTHTATFTQAVPADERSGVLITFTVLQGPSVGRTFTATTDSSGAASFSYTIPTPGSTLPGSLPDAGVDQIQATYVTKSGDVIGSNWAGQGWTKAAFGQNIPDRDVALVQTPGSSGFVAANETQDLPPGTVVDIAGHRGISIENIYGRRMNFIGVPDQVASRFVLINGLRTPGKPIRIKLAGGNFTKCKAGGGQGRSIQAYSASTKNKVKPIRRLWGFGKGRYETSGKYASATIVGTFWEVADFCDGTLVKVREGKVKVRDFVKNKLITITSGHAYFARSS